MLHPGEFILIVVLIAMILVGAWVGYHLVAQNGRLMLRLESLERRLTEQGVLREGVNPASLGMPPGSMLNDFALPALDGATVTLSQWRGRKLELIYLSPHCPHCEKLVPDLASIIAGNTPNDPATVIVSKGTAEENRKFFGAQLPSCPILLQEDSEVAALHMALGTPMAYLLDEHGLTLGSAAAGPTAVLNLLRNQQQECAEAANGHSPLATQGSLASSKINRNGLKAGTTAPEFSLPALDGKEVSLSSFRGRPVLLVFSDPNCRPCNELMPKLEEIHRNSRGLQVVVIARGDLAANREKARKLGLTFPIVLQRSWEVSRAYGMFSTPIGYLLDDDGVLLEDVAVGGNRILALATQRQSLTAQAG